MENVMKIPYMHDAQKYEHRLKEAFTKWLPVLERFDVKKEIRYTCAAILEQNVRYYKGETEYEKTCLAEDVEFIHMISVFIAKQINKADISYVFDVDLNIVPFAETYRFVVPSEVWDSYDRLKSDIGNDTDREILTNFCEKYIKFTRRIEGISVPFLLIRDDNNDVVMVSSL